MLRIALFGLILFVGSCTGVRNLSNRNLSYLYKPESGQFNPVVSAHFVSETHATVTVQFNSGTLLYHRSGDENYLSEYQVSYVLAESFEDLRILDSASFSFQVNKSQVQAFLINRIPVRVPIDSSRLMILTLRDLVKNFEEQFYLTIDNRNPQSRQHFAVFAMPDSLPLSRNYITSNESIRIQFRDKNVSQLYCRYYSRTFPLPPPPFSYQSHQEFEYAPDSIFIYFITDSGWINLTREGFYHFQVDTATREGLTLFRFNNAYPAINQVNQMIESIRYLTTKKEFETIKENSNPRESIDRFWMGLGLSAEKSRELIKKYYTRIKESNIYFTSYTEGWRTDRGMIYTIFGRPHNVYKSSVSETWIYGSPNNMLSLTFFFTRVINPFSENDFTLTREPVFEPHWYRAVELWRQGKVYNDN